MRCRYRISARSGELGEALLARFGEPHSVHELNDTQLVDLLADGHRFILMLPGEFTLLEVEDAADLEFQNDYD